MRCQCDKSNGIKIFIDSKVEIESSGRKIRVIIIGETIEIIGSGKSRLINADIPRLSERIPRIIHSDVIRYTVERIRDNQRNLHEHTFSVISCGHDIYSALVHPILGGRI